MQPNLSFDNDIFLRIQDESFKKVGISFFFCFDRPIRLKINFFISQFNFNYQQANKFNKNIFSYQHNILKHLQTKGNI